MKEVIDEIDPQTFYLDWNKDIFKAMAYLHYSHSPIDYSNVMDRLQYKGFASNHDIMEYTLGLADSVLSTANFSQKVTNFVDLYQKRKLYQLGQYLTSKDIKGVSTDNLLKYVENSMDTVNVSSNLEITNTKNYINEWYDEFKSGKVKEIISFGFKKLDDLVMLSEGNLGIIGARPSVGKSAYALNIGINICKQGKHVLLVSLEMSDEEVMNRLVAYYSEVEHDKIQRGMTLTNEEKKRIEGAKKEIEGLNLYIFDRGMMTPMHLENLAKKLKKQGKLDTVIVDYLQLMDSGKKNLSGVQDVTYISRKLKQLAQELSIPVIALSQLSRKSVGQDGKPREPQLSDLRESGAIEQDANFVLMLHSDDAEGKFEEHRYIKMFVRKNRSGALGKINMTYFGDYMHFVEKEYDPNKGDFVEVVQRELSATKQAIGDDLPF